ncbi:V-type ATPase subunit a family protein [Eubacterium callanderi]|uniref:V-type ATPase subunit a family protein n=2 Tax=Eubacteriaceae TaxID=186806 RepID=UPI00210BF64A|nr:V-type ATPase subunit a family protein [Eubacterium callanderi]MCQ5188283.1 V-type ATPase subunit a family protein [Eubacterium callanderi]
MIKEEVRRMEEISQQTIFLCENQIDTYEQLKEKQAEMDDLISQRKKLTNKMRRAAFDEKETLSQQKKGLSDQISVLRKDLKWSLGVEKRSLDMVDRIIILFKKLDRIAKKRVQMSSLFY